MSLPRYIVERTGIIYAIWDTKEHEYTGFEYDTKEAAQVKCDLINNI